MFGMFGTDQSTKSDEKKSDSLLSDQKEINSVKVQLCRANLSNMPQQYFVTISYKDNTKKEEFTDLEGIWKNYFAYLNKEDKRLFIGLRNPEPIEKLPEKSVSMKR